MLDQRPRGITRFAPHRKVVEGNVWSCVSLAYRPLLTGGGGRDLLDKQVDACTLDAWQASTSFDSNCSEIGVHRVRHVDTFAARGNVGDRSQSETPPRI